jgi:hypothetical protein
LLSNSIKGIVTDSDGLLKELLSGAASPAEITIALGDTARDLLATRPDDSPLVEVTRYWTALQGGRELPKRSDINPVEISPAALPHVTLVDVVPGNPRRFKYRLVGTEVAAIFGADYTGFHMDEIVPPILQEQVQRAYDFGCNTGDIVIFYGAYVRADGSFYTVTRVALPVVGPDGEIDCFLSAVTRELDWKRGC